MSKFMTLLVEDDPTQRMTLADLFRQNGFEVIECATAEAAELVIATSGTELSAVVTDQNLEGQMLGSELASFARKQYPKLNIIVVSGDEAPRLPVGVNFMRKPFAPPDLLDAVRAGA
jgi:DNA-binding response OmpR family regulator